MKLYELTDAYQRLLDLADDTDSDFTDALADLSDDIEFKVESIAKLVKTLESKESAYKAEKDRFAEKEKVVANKIKRLKEYVQESMDQVGAKKIEGELFTVAIQKSPVSLKIEDERYIPEGYWVPQEPKLNKKELLEDLKQGTEVVGVELTQGEHLRIR